eukprot:1049529-Rhodomonas_salina.2
MRRGLALEVVGVLVGGVFEGDKPLRMPHNDRGQHRAAREEGGWRMEDGGWRMDERGERREESA